MQNLGLQPRPDRYVAFAFAAVNDLPYSAATGSTVALPVTIDNHRAKATAFHITASGAKAATAVGSGSAIVPSGVTRTLTLRVHLRCVVQKHTTAASLPTARVVLTLVPTNESITHTMFCRARS